MPKKLVMMMNIKIKGISRCANCLANKLFFVKIKDKDELEVLLCLNFSLISYKTDHVNLLCKM